MQSRPQRYTFYAISILSIVIVGVGWLRLSEILEFSDEISYSGLSVSVALFFVAWIYPLKAFDEDGVIIGMHREALKASGLFIFISICMPIDERFSSYLPEWGNICVDLGVLVMAIVLYKIMVILLSDRSSRTKKLVEQVVAGNPLVAPESKN